MIIDSSVLVAIILSEDGSEQFLSKMLAAEVRFLSSGTYLEASVVLLKRLGAGGELELDRLIDELGIAVVPVTSTQVLLGRDAFLRLGKGKHPAKLNFGDCFSYALAKSSDLPLLFKGNDFSQTDIQAA